MVKHVWTSDPKVIEVIFLYLIHAVDELPPRGVISFCNACCFDSLCQVCARLPRRCVSQHGPYLLPRPHTGTASRDTPLRNWRAPSRTAAISRTAQAVARPLQAAACATTAAARTQPASHTLLADEDAAKSIGRIFVAEERVFQLVP